MARIWCWPVAACLAIILGGCERHARPAKPREVQRSAKPCEVQAAELRAFLTAIFDPDADVKAPWPTGDPELDERIERGRAKVRAAMKPADPGDRMARLSPGVDTRADEEMYRDCPQGLAALQAVSKAPAARRREAFIRIADAVEECGCQVDIRLLKAAYYLLVRGPD